jgi:dipeptidyl aminopeptidase/acylaminoacyl peptidase
VNSSSGTRKLDSDGRGFKRQPVTLESTGAPTRGCWPLRVRSTMRTRAAKYRRPTLAVGPAGLRMDNGSRCPHGNVCQHQDRLGDEARIILTGHSDLVRCVDWSPDGKFLVTGGNDNTVKTWDGSTGQEIATLRGHTDQVNDVKWCPDGRQLATVGNGTVKVWNVPEPIQQPTAEFALGSGMMIRCLAWNEDGTALAAGGTAGVKILDASSGEVVSDIGPERAANWSQFSPTFDWRPASHTIAVQRSKAVVLFDDRTLQETHVLVPLEGAIRSVALSPDGLRVATSSWDEKRWKTRPSFRSTAWQRAKSNW